MITLTEKLRTVSQAVLAETELGVMALCVQLQVRIWGLDLVLL